MSGNKNDYNKSIRKIYKKLKTSSNGLSCEEAFKRLQINGFNKLEEKEKTSNIWLFLNQFNDLLVILLLVSVCLSFTISIVRHESYLESIIILLIVLVNATLSFIQEKKADKAIEELNKMFITHSCVIRNGIKKIIDVRELVVGDIVSLTAGDYIAADARIISCENLLVNESTLTGESKGVKKNNKTLRGKKELYERTNMVFAGCNVLMGCALVVVTATGMNTELGKIANNLDNGYIEITPLQKRVNEVSKILTYIILIIILIMLCAGFLMKKDFLDTLMLSVSLAVAAIPEGLSSIITIILSLGMADMAKKNVIIRKMSSVETLGSTDIICSDKTGTITKNDMVVKKIYVNDELYTDDDIIPNSNFFIEALTNCQNVFKNSEGYVGDETEVAIYKYLEKKNNVVNSSLRLKEYPFDSERKMMSTINIIDNHTYSFTKGSLDTILNRCQKYLINDNLYNMNLDYQEKILNIEKDLSLKSFRLLAVAYKNQEIDDPENNMIFLGLIGMMDPPREKVYSAVSTCQKAGLRVIMITGDSLNTALAIAKEVQIIGDNGKGITGKEIDNMSSSKLKEVVKNYQVYARINPTTKLKIVDALQSLGYVVAMTGDGVNDAPAIKKANIGIGMGQNGTEVVKRVADCILTDDSFSTIVDGVAEGRRISLNIKKVILYLLVGNIVEVILVFVSLLLNVEIFTTLQLLWINLVTDSIPAIMLAFEEEDNDLMTDSPTNKPCSSFFTPFLVGKIVITSLFKAFIMFILYLYFLKHNSVNAAGSLMFIYLIINELLYSLSCRNLKKSILNKNIFSNKRLTIGLLILILIQLSILITPLSKFLIDDNLGVINILITILVCFGTFIIGEMIKPLYGKLFKDYIEK